jgi:hypothetical protein
VINVRFGPHCELKSDILRGPRSAKSSLMQCSKQDSFNHPVGNGKQRGVAVACDDLDS